MENTLSPKVIVDEEHIYIAGWKEVSLVDIIEHTSFTLWTAFCNFNCPWCSNSLLARGLGGRKVHVNTVISALEEAKDFVDFLHVTGGEPTLQYKPLKYILNYSKTKLNIKTSIATNGSNPNVIGSLASILDHVALDVKAPLNNAEKYSKVIGLPVKTTKRIIPRIAESIKVSIEKIFFVEIRTTMIPKLVEAKEIEEIAYNISEIVSKAKGKVVYVVQQFIPYENILDEKYRKMKRTDPEKVVEAAKKAAEILPIKVYFRTLEYGTKQIR